MKDRIVTPVAIPMMDGTYCAGKKYKTVRVCENTGTYKTPEEAIAAAEQELYPLRVRGAA